MKKIKASDWIEQDGKCYHLGMRSEQLADNIFFVGDPARAEKVAKYFDETFHTVKKREYITITGTYQDLPVSVMSTGIGTDNNEIALVEIFGLKGFEKSPGKQVNIIRIGTSGGMQEDIDPGTFAVSEYAVGIDNTGLFYNELPADDQCVTIEEEVQKMMAENTPVEKRFRGKIMAYVSKASPGIVKALQNNIKDDFVTGITVAAPGFYAPQGREIPGLNLTLPGIQEHLAKINVNGRRIINFEMESSLIFHLAAHLGFRAGTICAVIANRPKGTFLEDYSKSIDNAIQTALGAMKEIAKNEK